MADDTFPKPTADLAKRRKCLAPDVESAFHDFSKAVFREGALSRKHKQLIAVAVAHVTQCPPSALTAFVGIPRLPFNARQN